jgi:hypothetical protein
MLSSLSLALLSKKENASSTVIDLHTPAHQESSTTESSTATPVESDQAQPAEQAAPAEETQPEAERVPATP